MLRDVPLPKSNPLKYPKTVLPTKLMTQSVEPRIKFTLSDSSINPTLDNQHESDAISNFNAVAEEVKDVLGYRIVSKSYGLVRDFLLVSMVSSDVQFFKKRYLRVSNPSVVVEFDHSQANASFGPRQKRFKFLKSKNLIDRVKIACLEPPLTLETARNGGKVETSKPEAEVTLTYEVEPNMVYNFVFKATCSE